MFISKFFPLAYRLNDHQGMLSILDRKAGAVFQIPINDYEKLFYRKSTNGQNGGALIGVSWIDNGNGLDRQEDILFSNDHLTPSFACKILASIGRKSLSPGKVILWVVVAYILLFAIFGKTSGTVAVQTQVGGVAPQYQSPESAVARLGAGQTVEINGQTMSASQGLEAMQKELQNTAATAGAESATGSPASGNATQSQTAQDAASAVIQDAPDQSVPLMDQLTATPGANTQLPLLFPGAQTQ